jgi:hypothetical protein
VANKLIIEEQEVFIIPPDLGVPGIQMLAVTDGVGDSFAQSLQRVFPDDLPGRLTDKFKAGLKVLAEVTHRAFDLVKVSAIDLAVIHDESGRAEPPDFNDR